MKMAKPILFAAALTAVLTLNTSARAQLRDPPDDGIAASPKLRQMLNEQKKVASPKLSQMLAELKKVGGDSGTRELAANDGITASPKLREQMRDRAPHFQIVTNK